MSLDSLKYFNRFARFHYHILLLSIYMEDTYIINLSTIKIRNMDPFLLYVSVILLGLAFIFYAFTSKPYNKPNLPPGSFGWPFLGETYEFLYTKPETFIRERMKKHNPRIFKTNLFGEPTVVLCGTFGHKFIASNEGKLMTSWRSLPMQKLFRGSYQRGSRNSTISRHSETQITRSPLLTKPETLNAYASAMDSMTKHHFLTHWLGRSEIEVHSLHELLTVTIATRIFVGIEDPKRVAKMAKWLGLVVQGVDVLPYDIPGTCFARAMKAAEAIRNEMLEVIKEKRVNLSKGEKPCDMVSYLMISVDENGKCMAENEVADKTIGLLSAALIAPSIALTFIIKYVAENPQVYQTIKAEQMEIARSKKAGEALVWSDIQKMKHSWNVSLEVMRLVPPSQGTFREAITEFTYQGYTIPKGWKIYWTVSSTNKDPEIFKEPERFDPSRFEREIPPFLNVPFGGGPRICPGKDYAKLQILIYLHHLILTSLQWEILNNVNSKDLPPKAMNPIPPQGIWVRLKPST